MINYNSGNENSKKILTMDDEKTNLLLEVEFLMEAMKSGHLCVEKGYASLVELILKHREAA